MSYEATFDPDALRKEFADYCADVEPGIKAKTPKLNQLETLALISMSVFQAAKELKAEKAQQAARIAELEALLVKANDAWLAMSKTATVAPAVDAQPVAIVTETHDSRGKPDLYTIMATSKLRIGDRLYSSAQLEGLRKDAERYRWLRAAYTRVVAMPEQGPNLDMVAIGEIGDSLESSALDAAIDACLKRTRSD